MEESPAAALTYIGRSDTGQRVYYNPEGILQRISIVRLLLKGSGRTGTLTQAASMARN